MKNLKTALLGAAALAFLAGPAAAQEVRGFYVEGNAGANWLSDLDFDMEYTGVPIGAGEMDFDTGFAVGARAGYGFDSGLRVEGEITYRENDNDSLSVAYDQVPLPSDEYEHRGDANSLALMGNVYWDFLNDSAFTPYIGAGLGAARLDRQGEITVDPNGNPFLIVGSGDTTWTVAAQARAGAAYAVTPNISLTADYTYFRAFDPTLESDLSAVISNNSYPTGLALVTRDDWENHTVMAGLRYTFGQPATPIVPPAAEPVAPPPAQQTFLVFFDFDRSNLTAEANNTLDQVVVAHNEQQVTRIMVDGHTDRSGPASYNQGLSERRAESVRQGLIARGVAPDEIVTRAFGETQNLVPTPDGVREPQNRRVEIIFS